MIPAWLSPARPSSTRPDPTRPGLAPATGLIYLDDLPKIFSRKMFIYLNVFASKWKTHFQDFDDEEDDAMTTNERTNERQTASQVYSRRSKSLVPVPIPSSQHQQKQLSPLVLPFEIEQVSQLELDESRAKLIVCFLGFKKDWAVSINHAKTEGRHGGTSW